MNQLKANIWRILLAALVMIPIVLLLTWVLQDIARRLVVIPSSYVLWWFRRLLESTPQLFIWIAMIVVMGILIGKSLSARAPSNSEPPPPDRSYLRRSRLRYWITQLNQQSEFSRSRLVEFVDRLVLDVLTYSYHLPTWQVEKRLLDGEIQAPGELVTLLRIRKQSPSYQTSTPLGFLKNLFFLIKNRLATNPEDGQRIRANRELETILDYLEDQLEIHHDN